MEQKKFKVERSPESPFDLVIVGGGLAGLSVAHYILLEAPNTSIILIEKDPKFGGRLQSQTFCGTKVDTGAQWVGPQQTELLELLMTLDIKTYKQKCEGRPVLQMNGKTCAYSSALTQILDFGTSLQEYSNVCKHYLSGSYCPSSSASSSLTQWAEEHISSNTVRDLFFLIVKTIFSQEPKEINTHHFFYYVNYCDGWKAMSNTKNGAQESKIYGTTREIISKLKKELQRKNVVFMKNTPVESVQYDSDNRCYEIGLAGQNQDSGFQQVYARCCVMAVPPSALAHIQLPVPFAQSAHSTESFSEMSQVGAKDQVASPLFSSNNSEMIQEYSSSPPLQKFSPMYNSSSSISGSENIHYGTLLSQVSNFRPGSVVKIMVALKRDIFRERNLSGEFMSDTGPLCFGFHHNIPEELQPDFGSINHQNLGHQNHNNNNQISNHEESSKSQGNNNSPAQVLNGSQILKESGKEESTDNDMMINPKKAVKRRATGSPIQNVLNAPILSTPTLASWQKPFILVLYSVGAQVQALMSISPEERRKSVVAHLNNIFKPVSYMQFDCAPEVVDYCEYDWSQRAYFDIMASSQSVSGAYLRQLLGDSLRNQPPRLYFIGSEFSQHWPGYMNGAVHSAKRVSTEILNDLRK